MQLMNLQITIETQYEQYENGICIQNQYLQSVFDEMSDDLPGYEIFPEYFSNWLALLSY